MSEIYGRNKNKNLTNGTSFGCKYNLLQIGCCCKRVLISSYKLALLVKLGARIQNMALESSLSPLHFPVFLRWLFSCILSLEQPLHLHNLETTSPAEHLVCLDWTFPAKVFCCSLTLIASSLWGRYFSDCPYMGIEAHPTSEIHDLRVRMGTLIKIEGHCLNSESRCWRVTVLKCFGCSVIYKHKVSC